MKKVVLTLATFAVVACLASCSKKCNCTQTLNGNEVLTWTVDIGGDSDVKKCRDLNSTTTALNQTTETKCKSQL